MRDPMAWAAMAVLAVFYGIYFWKMLAQRRKGIRTDQMARGGKEPRVLRVEAALKAVTCAVPGAELLSILLGWSALPQWARWAGLLTGAAGAAVFGLSVFTMRDSWRAGIPEGDRTELVTGGIYSVSRNPAFLGFDLVYLGILLMFWNPLLLAVSAAAAGMLHLQIRQEERFLADAFGEAYLGYRDRVGRYLGRK